MCVLPSWPKKEVKIKNHSLDKEEEVAENGIGITIVPASGSHSTASPVPLTPSSQANLKTQSEKLLIFL